MRFEVLGGVRAFAGERPVAFSRRRERCLLGLLLLEAGRPIPMDRLVELLWEHPPEYAKRSVHSYVARLRAVLTEADPGVTLRTEGAGYLLDVAADCVDVHRFRSLVAAAQDEPDLALRASMLRDALGLWRGPVLGDDVESAWRDRLAADWAAWHLTAQEQWLAALVGCRRWDEALAPLARLAAEQPARERFTELHMLALYGAGRKADALTAYERTRRWLAEHLGIDPTPALREAHQAILRDAVEPVPVAAQGSPMLHNLPRDVADFVAREHDLEWLDDTAESADGAGTVAVIAGAAGVGKTALALRWAHRVAEKHFPAGQMYLNLRGYGSGQQPLRPLEALTYLLRCLGVPGDQVPGDVEQASAHYRSLLATRQLLIVLDNANSAGQVRPLLPGAGPSHVVITSRDRLSGLVAHDGAKRLTVSLLSADDGVALLGRVAGERRVAEEPEAAARLVGLCAGLPLALRIVAAKLADQPRSTLAAHARDLAEGNRLALLTVVGDEDRAVKTVLDQSYLALRPPEQRALRLMGLVPLPDFTAEAVAALLGLGQAEALTVMEGLCAAHLVEQPHPRRFTLHDLIREFAYLVSRENSGGPHGESAEAAQRLLSYLRDMVASANSFLISQEGSAPDGLMPRLDSAACAMAWLEAERANLTAAVSAAAAVGQHELACQIAGPMGQFFHFAGHIGDWISTFETASAATEHLGQSKVRYFVLNSLGNAYTRAGHVDRAEELLRQAIEGRENLGDALAAASSRHNLAAFYETVGRYEEAMHLEDLALATSRKFGDRSLESLILGAGKSNLYQKMGLWQEALDCLLQALRIDRALGSPFALARTLNNIGWSYLRLGRLDSARRHLEEGLELARQVSDRYLEPLLMAGLAGVHRALGEHDTALRLRLDALPMVRVALPTHEPEFLNGLAELFADRGDDDEALRHYERAAEEARRFDDPLELGRALAGAGALRDSRDHLEQALCLLEPINSVEAEKVRQALAGLDSPGAAAASAAGPDEGSRSGAATTAGGP